MFRFAKRGMGDGSGIIVAQDEGRVLEDLLHPAQEGRDLPEVEGAVIEAEDHGQNAADLHLFLPVLIRDDHGLALQRADADGEDLRRDDR